MAKTTQTTSAASNQQANSIFGKAVFMHLEIKSIGNSRSISTNYVSADTDRKMLQLTKHLLDSKELKAKLKLDNQLKHYLSDNCLPSVIKRGVYILPLVSVETINAYITNYKEKSAAAIETFIAMYPLLVEQSRMRLGELWRVQDYPGAYLDGDGALKFNSNYGDIIRGQFGFHHGYLHFEVPDILEKINKQLYDDAKAETQQLFVDAAKEVQDLLRFQLLELVQDLSSKLAPAEDGKKAKVLNSKKLEKAAEVLAGFHNLNVIDDKELTELVKQAQQLLQGVEADKLKDNLQLKETLTTEFGAMAAKLDTMIVNKPKRAMSFDD